MKRFTASCFLAFAAPLLARCETSPTPTPTPWPGSRNDITVYMTEEEALKTVFPHASRVVQEDIALSADEHRDMETILGRGFPEKSFTMHAGIQEDGQFDGFAVIHAEVGKFKLFHFIVGIEPDGSVRRVAVLVYRESRGAEVARRRFAVQYDGKTLADPIHINRDIIKIAGATMSVNSLNRGVKKVLALVEVVYRRQPERLRALLALKGETAVNFRTDSLRADSPKVGRGVVEFRGARYLMGALCEILACGADREALRGAVSRAFLEVEAADRALSDYRPSSELSLISRCGSAADRPVSEVMGEFLRAAESISRESGGAFALTLGPLVRAWGLREKGAGPAIAAGPPIAARPPRAEDLEALRPLLGPENILLSRAPDGGGRDPGGRDGPGGGWTVRLAREGVQLDPGALGKGFAVDLAVQSLRRDGVRSALVNFSGNIYALGAPPGELAWEVAVRDPTQPDRVLGVLQLSDAAVAASGAYEKGEHILSPRTLRPVRGVLGTAVVAPSATLADGYSTAGYVLAEGVLAEGVLADEAVADEAVAGDGLAGERGFEALEFFEKKAGVEGFIARRADDGSAHFASTKGWKIR